VVSKVKIYSEKNRNLGKEKKGGEYDYRRNYCERCRKPKLTKGMDEGGLPQRVGNKG